MNYIIGLDVGTTATKGTVYDINGKKVAELKKGYPLIQLKEDQAEEDPRLIFAAVQKIIFKLSKMVKGKVIAISWSSQMHSLIGLNKNGELLTNSITWADNRAKDIVLRDKESGLALKIYQQTGMPVHPMAPVYKLAWLKENKPELFTQVDKWVDIKTYLLYRLTGEVKEDITMAAGTGLFSLKKLVWDQTILNRLGLKDRNFPQLVQPTAVIGKMKDEYVHKLDLPADVKVIAGASDGYLSTVGVGAVDKNEFALNVGTSGAVRMFSKKVLLDKKARFFCYPSSKNNYLLGGPVNNGGIIFEWAKKMLLGPQATAKDFLDLAQTAPAGSDGLLFHPYLGGERAPIWDSNARGSFVGLTRKHTKAYMARSVLEGIIFNLRAAAHLLTASVGKPKELRITGGFVRSNFVRQMIANIFAIPVVTMKNDQSGTLAAMLLARQELGFTENHEKIKNLIKEDKTYFPDQKEAELYQNLFPLYCEIGQDLETSYAKIAAFQKRQK